MIRLVLAHDDDKCMEISDMMFNSPGIKEIFRTLSSRLAVSEYSFLIKDDDITIGFINLVDEKLNGFLFLDMGIKEEYRGKGCGREALRILVSELKGIDKYIIGETGVQNKSANGVVDGLSCLICEKDGFNYYVIPGDKLTDLENNPSYNDLINHFGNIPTKKKVLK